MPHIPNPMNPIKKIIRSARNAVQGVSQEELTAMRHTLAHLLGEAVLELYPSAKRSIGPAIDNGFYYDFEFIDADKRRLDAELGRIEAKMRELLPTWSSFTHRDLSKSEALEEYPNNEYKRELIEEFTKDGSRVSFYTSGNFTDLCRGGHVENPSKDIEPDAFKLTHIAGAYWRGDEKNKMLTRIYGLAFATREDLEAYEKMQEEAKKRDHKILGQQLDLFVFSELIGGGLPLWTPRGTLVRNLLDERVWKLRKARGYQQVDIPHITKKELYEKSGHWDKFKDELMHIKTRVRNEANELPSSYTDICT